MTPVSADQIFSPWTPGLLSFVVYGGMVLVLVGTLLLLTRWLGERRVTLEKSRPYESGVIPTGSAHFTYPVPFYLVAVFFLVFDVEAVYILSWAVALEPLGWYGWLQISLFIFILMMGLVYIWRKGGLEWGSTVTNRQGQETSS